MQKENQFTIIGKNFVERVKSINFEKETNFMPILDVLNLIKIKEGYVLDFYKTDTYEYHTLPYIRRIDEERRETGQRWQMMFTQNEPDIFSDLEIPFTEMGVWQGYLLHILPGFTPKNGHACYAETEEVYGYDDFISYLTFPYEMDDRCKINDLIESLIMNSSLNEPPQELIDSILDALRIETFLPKVEIITKNEATVESFFFSKFGGLVYEATTAIRNGNSLKFKYKDQKVLRKYNCGICY